MPSRAATSCATALTDPHLPASRRQQIVEDLLGGKASPSTISLVGMAVGTGRARELPSIIDSLVAMAAAEADKAVAEVRSAIELTEDQRTRLADAIGRATGKQVEVKVVVDPSSPRRHRHHRRRHRHRRVRQDPPRAPQAAVLGSTCSD